MDRSLIRTVVRPIIGDTAWRALRAPRKRAKARRARERALQPYLDAARTKFEEDRVLAAATRIRQERAATELERRSRAGDLTWLGRHFKTDKAGTHQYTQHYARHFAHLRDREVVVLEIGIGGYSREGAGGASLRMWKHYFRNGRIHGLDIEDKSFVDEDRIRSFQGSQDDPDLLRRIVDEIGRPDVVIDDGSHRPEHILATFDVLFPLLADDGIYVVEDTQTSYWPEWGGAEDPEDRSTSMAMLKRLADGLNHVEYVVEPYEPTYTDRHVVGVHFYHNLVFVQKGLNTEGTRKKAILRQRYAEPPAAAVPQQSRTLDADAAGGDRVIGLPATEGAGQVRAEG